MKELVFLGAACVVAAVIGGGLKWAGMEIPVLQSAKRQVLLAVVGCLLIAGGVAPNVRRADATSNSSGASSSAKLVSSPEPPVSPFVARHQLDRRYCEFAKDDAAIPDFLSPSECRSNPSIFYCVSASRQGRLEDGCFDTMAHCYARSGEFVSMHFDILERCDRIVVEKATPR